LNERNNSWQVAQVKKINIVNKNGVQPMPLLPIVSMMMFFSMNSTMISARLREPFGALRASFDAATKNNTVPMTALKIEMITTLLMPGVTSFQRRIVLIGGKLKPRPDSALGTSF